MEDFGNRVVGADDMIARLPRPAIIVPRAAPRTEIGESGCSLAFARREAS